MLFVFVQVAWADPIGILDLAKPDGIRLFVHPQQQFGCAFQIAIGPQASDGKFLPQKFGIERIVLVA